MGDYSFPTCRESNRLTAYWKGIKAMNQSQFTRIAAVSIGLLVLLLSRASLTEARSVNLPSPQCHPSIIQSMPPKIRKICDALSTIWEFSEAMENYLDEKALEEEEEAMMDSMLEPQEKLVAERRSLPNNSVKRK